MSIICGLPLIECVYCLACARWAWKRCLHTAGHNSETWGLATAEEFEPVPRMCRYILAVYEDDIRHPLWEPPADMGSTLIGFNLAKESDYQVLLDNKLGKRKFDGGYVHNGLLKAAGWVLDAECDVLKELVEEYPNYTLTFAGHSLGSGVAAMLALVVVRHQDKLYAIAPVRCDHVRYRDIDTRRNRVIVSPNVESILLRVCCLDDFLPRTATPLEDIFKSLFYLPCLLCLRCMTDTCIPEEKMLKDPRRLYAPGRLYHIVDRKTFRLGRFPPVVRTAVPVDGRLEHIVLSCNATSDHAIIWIEREAQRAMDLMLEKDRIMVIPGKQRMERQETLAKEHSQEYRAALQRAASLSVPHAYYSPSKYGTFDESEEGENSCKSSSESSSFGSSSRSKNKESWNELIKRLFDKDESRHRVLKKSHTNHW
ncbi:putative 60S ribosomal protein L36e [Hibiscus syriacus]|uniref:60S ribosomal protein L36e n=1 Tax=Hibiscus syriacus TaxID=106335 RepID=A0A6A3CX20_HIBSY|nr:putative 60S ribosomal protein L36e [Hibiscus syriacus]